VLVHATPKNPLNPSGSPPGLGAVSCDQVVPFHRTLKSADPDAWFPTAMQLVVLRQETSCSEPVLIVAGSSDQLVPFHVSMADPLL
jgi:hypothetical protein